MVFVSRLAALLPFVPALVQAYANPIGCSGDCFTHDPAVIKRADGKYFRFSTLDGISIRTATDLAGPWTQAGSVIQGAGIINAPGNTVLWAPDVSYMRGLYYLFYAVSTSGSKTSTTGYATSPSLDAGTWTDQGAILSSTDSSPYNAIDATLVNGTNPDEFYLAWGSYWGQIYQAQVAIDGHYVFVSGNQKQIAYNPNPQYTEGAFLYRKDSYYYLFLSVGVCCTYTTRPTAGTEYHVNVCRSTSPTGPFVDKNGNSCTNGGGTTVLASHDNVYAPGGQGVLVDDKYGEVLYYHYLDPTVGVDYSQSKFGFNKLVWVDGWPTV
ncbi:putative arabinan endo-1,5-alpha-L-arabinosidase C [Thozetella sp. PMI_491]|nr:putative arabinan endo-1,5-alpha-L-arabinosidase C [Thozetella sp. PMI_491]